MSRGYSLTIDGSEYEGSTASAKEQFEALHLIGNTVILTGLKERTTDMGLVVLILQLPLEKVERLVDLLMKKYVFRASDKVPVGENLFGDDVQNYYLLLGYVLRENLRNFWKLRLQTEDAKKAGPKD